MDETCQRCREPRPNVGSWNGEGGYTRLCGGCKMRLTLTPERTAAFEKEMSALASEVTGERVTVVVETGDEGRKDN